MFMRNRPEQLEHCICCPRKCGVNRLAGERGFCGQGSDPGIAHIGLHHGEEPPISGNRGSGTIFFTGCNLNCVFCQNFAISQEFDKTSAAFYSPETLAQKMLGLQNLGAHNINLVSPSHYIYPIAESIQIAKEKGLRIPVVYNSNGYDSVDALKDIRGLIDIYLPDLKYMDNALSQRYSKAKDYADVIPDVLREMLDQVGHLTLDANGIATRGLLVRHLVLPGQVENSKRCLDLLAGLSSDIFISIMSQYSPQYHASTCQEINRPLSPEEYAEVIDYADDLGLENAFVQEMESRDHYLPDFGKEEPFG